MHSRPDRTIGPLTLLAIVSALISGCSDSVLSGGEEDPSDNPTYETQVSGRCTFKIVRNVYDGPNWWGTITVSNRGSVALSAFTIAFDIPSGARCDYAETGWRHTQTGSTCRYSRPGMILKPGARIAVHYSTTSQGFSAATHIKLSDPACDVTAAPDASPARPDAGPTAEPDSRPPLQPDSRPPLQPDSQPAVQPDSRPATKTDAGASAVPKALFFDDFDYASATDNALTSFGWEARSGSGGPGNGSWSPSLVTFVNGPINKVLRLGATIKGGSSVQSELDYNKVKMLEGTYAARVFYTDTPDMGNDGAVIVEAGFWTMSDWASTSGTSKYSELDFEYLPNGGWGQAGPAMFKTAWYNDTLGDSIDTVTPGSFAGWHTVMLVVSQGQVKYYDGNKLLASHGGKYYPRSKMNLIPQLWFFQNNVDSTWHIDVDWLFYAQNTVLTSSEVEAHVDTLRALGVARRDTVQ